MSDGSCQYPLTYAHGEGGFVVCTFPGGRPYESEVPNELLDVSTQTIKARQVWELPKGKAKGKAKG